MAIWKSIKGFFGQTIHYKDGVKVGETWDGLLPGTKKHYDKYGGYIGYSAPGILADQVHYSESGERVGESWEGSFGVERHYGSNGFVGTSRDGFTGTTSYIDDDADTLFDRHDHTDDIFADNSSFDDCDW